MDVCGIVRTCGLDLMTRLLSPIACRSMWADADDGIGETADAREALGAVDTTPAVHLVRSCVSARPGSPLVAYQA